MLLQKNKERDFAECDGKSGLLWKANKPLSGLGTVHTKKEGCATTFATYFS